MSGQAAPLVSVVIPTHNSGALLERALGSVYAQTFRDFEIIVVDDASTDDTSERMQRHLDRVRYIKQDHAGSAVARNRGILVSQGEYIAFLDADDLWLPEKLERQIELAKRHPNASLIYSDFYRGEGEEIARDSGLRARKFWVAGQEFKSLLRQNFIHTSSVVTRKEALADAGIFDPNLINAQDWDLWIRLAAAGNVVFVDEVLSYYRIHSSQTVTTTKYLRNLVFADEVVIARWGRDADAVALLKAKLAVDLWMLGRREWKSGNVGRARAAYWRCAFTDGIRWKAIGRSLACSLPGWLLKWFK